MKKLLVVIFMAAAWVGGYGYGRWYAKPPAGERKPLYWVDPMHPWYKSDVPGIAPDCNMKLVPVMPGEEARYERRANKLPEGSVQITPEKQQLIGVEYGTVEYETVKQFRPRRGARGAGRNQNRQSAQQAGRLDRPGVRRFHRQAGAAGRPAAHHLQSRSAGHPAGISAGHQGAAHDARQPGARDVGQHGKPGGRRQKAHGAVGHRRERRSPRSPPPACR